MVVFCVLSVQVTVFLLCVDVSLQTVGLLAVVLTVEGSVTFTVGDVTTSAAVAGMV